MIFLGQLELWNCQDSCHPGLEEIEKIDVVNPVWGGFGFTIASNYLLLSLGFFQPAAHGGGLAKFRSEQLLCFSGISLMAAWINEAIFSIDPTQEANELPGGVKIPVGFSILKTWIIWDDPQVTTIYSRLNHQAEFGTKLFLLRALCSSNRSHAGSKWTACLAKFRSVFLLCFSGISLMAAWINEEIFSIDPTQEANELPGGVKIPVGFSILKTWIIWDDPQVTTIYSRLNHQAEFGTKLFLLRALCSSNRSHAGSKWTACLAKFRSVFLLCFSGISLMAAWPWKKVLDEAVALGVQGWCDKASKITVNLAIAWFTDVSSIKF